MTEMLSRGIDSTGVTRGNALGLRQVPSYSGDCDWNALMQDVDAVVHLAARVHVMRETSNDPLTLFREANVEAALNLARHAARSGVKRFVFISSVKVNGERTSPDKPFTAEDTPNPLDPYALSKFEAEQGLLALGQETGMEIVVIRPPLIYGSGVRGNFKLLVKWAALGAPSLFSKIKNKRSFIHVSNLTDLIVTALSHENATNRIFLASDGHDISTHDLLTLMMTLQGRRPRSIAIPSIFFEFAAKVPRMQNATARLTENLQVDFTATTSELGWTPKIKIADALRSSFPSRAH